MLYFLGSFKCRVILDLYPGHYESKFCKVWILSSFLWWQLFLLFYEAIILVGFELKNLFFGHQLWNQFSFFFFLNKLLFKAVLALEKSCKDSTGSLQYTSHSVSLFLTSFVVLLNVLFLFRDAEYHVAFSHCIYATLDGGSFSDLPGFWWPWNFGVLVR